MFNIDNDKPLKSSFLMLWRSYPFQYTFPPLPHTFFLTIPFAKCCMKDEQNICLFFGSSRSMTFNNSQQGQNQQYITIISTDIAMKMLLVGGDGDRVLTLARADLPPAPSLLLSCNFIQCPIKLHEMYHCQIQSLVCKKIFIVTNDQTMALTCYVFCTCYVQKT